MKSVRELVTDTNFILRLVEGILCLVGLIFYFRSVGVLMTVAFHGWLFVAISYILAYTWEEPNVWMEVFAFGLYAVLMLVTAFHILSLHCILPPIIVAVVVADLVVFMVAKTKN